jgi:hypothetical protein
MLQAALLQSVTPPVFHDDAPTEPIAPFVRTTGTPTTSTTSNQEEEETIIEVEVEVEVGKKIDIDIDKDKDCQFRNSPLYRSVYVYPSPGDEKWQGEILSKSGKQNTIDWPWIEVDERSKREGLLHYNPKSQFIQYTTEIFVRDIITHPNSCLRTDDPETATLFYVPYLPSLEYHNGTGSLGDYKTSPFGNALMDATDGNFNTWEQVFGLTSKYWQRRQGSDHILVMSEPLHGLWHPKSRRGNFHFVHSQKQLAPPIVLSVELSTTFVEMYPHCARTNIVLPYPNSDGQWFNGKLDTEAMELYEKTAQLHTVNSSAVLDSEKELLRQGNTKDRPRPLAQFYGAGNHGTCRLLRKSLKRDYDCSASGRATKRHELKNYAHGYRQATFCPCPGGDSPSAKRMFDALHAGCIPIVLSHDFVWPFTAEVDTVLASNTTSTTNILLDPNDFSIRVPSKDFLEAKHYRNCTKFEAASGDLQAYMESIPLEEIQRLRRGVQHATDTYSYYTRRAELPDNPLRVGILPDGGAAHSLVAALSERANGVLWPACRDELGSMKKNPPTDPNAFKC